MIVSFNIDNEREIFRLISTIYDRVLTDRLVVPHAMANLTTKTNQSNTYNTEGREKEKDEKRNMFDGCWNCSMTPIID
jgi:hypothetical protein